MPPSVGNELPHGAMHTDPEIIDRLHEGLGVLVRDRSGCIPPGTPADHVEDDVLADEEQVTFYLIVEFVGNFHTADVVWTRLSPLTADFTCLNYFWNPLEHRLSNAHSVQKSLHDMLRGMPPPDM